MKKQIISVIAVAALLFTLCVPAFAASHTTGDFETETIGDFVYEKGTQTIVGYAGNSPEITIPENVVIGEEFKFTSRGLMSENGEYVNVKRFIVSKGVTVSGTLGFGAYSGFTDVEFYNTAEEMPDVIFLFTDDENLTKLILPEGLTEIPDGMCDGCTSLNELYIPGSVSKIGEKAFRSCKKISELSLPKSLEKIGNDAFKDCVSIRKIYVPSNIDYSGLFVPYELETAEFEGEPVYNEAFYSTFLRTKWFENNIMSKIDDSDFIAADGVLFKYIGKDDKPSVPEGIRVIGEGAFSYTNIDTVKLPETLERIEEAAFYYSTLKSIAIPKSVESIGDNAFEWCPFLEKITFEGTPEIGLNAVVLTDILTEENIIFKNGEGNTKQQILDNGFVEYGTTAYDEILNSNRRKMGLEEVTVPEVTEKSKSTDAPSDSEESDNPKVTDKPSEAPMPKTLEVDGSDMTIRIDDNVVAFPDAKPFIDDNDRTQIPIRAVAEMLECEVAWDDTSKTAEITSKTGEIVTLTIGSDIMTVNGETVQMDTAAIIKDERTYIPVRFVAEAMGLVVEWIK